LAHDICMMLRFDKRTVLYTAASYVLPLGRDENPCVKQDRTINASGFGWRMSSHSGFKGKGELTFGLNWKIQSDETPLPQIWSWFKEVERAKGFIVGKE
jgi:hypothetical protein